MTKVTLPLSTAQLARLTPQFRELLTLDYPNQPTAKGRTFYNVTPVHAAEAKRLTTKKGA